MAGKINRVGTSRPSTASRSGGRHRETTAEILHGGIGGALIVDLGEVSANQMILDTVQALGADGKSMSSVDKLGNIQYTLQQALVDNRNFIQQDSFKAVD
jgi:hypothetical protein